MSGRALSLSTRIEATGRVPVPVCFGYRLYVRRDPVACAVVLPRRRQLLTDERLFPTGAAEPRTARAVRLATAARPYRAALKIAVDDAVEPVAVAA